VAHPTALTLEDELRAVDAWWREAGVDHVFVDEPVNWLAVPEAEDAAETPEFHAPQVVAPEPEPIELLAGGPDNWPTTLEAFDQWWLTEEKLALGPYRRVAATGPANAPLMVLMSQPLTDEAETLLSGDGGALLTNILTACGLKTDEVRIASLLPSHLPHPDWTALDKAGWGDLTRHHISLAAPQRLLVFGHVTLPLLGHDPAQGPAAFREVALQGATVPAVVARGLDTMLLRPRLRASLWQRWLEWTDE